MTDVEKVKQYLTMSSEDEAKAIEYLHQEIDPIDQKCRIEICEELLQSNEAPQDKLYRIMRALGDLNPYDKKKVFAYQWRIILQLIDRNCAEAMAEAISICGALDDSLNQYSWERFGRDAAYDAYAPYASSELRDKCVRGAENSSSMSALRTVAECYEKGRYGVEEDKKKALMLYKRAEQIRMQSGRKLLSTYNVKIGNLSAELGDAVGAMWAYKQSIYKYQDGRIYILGDEGDFYEMECNIGKIIFAEHILIGIPVEQFINYVVTNDDVNLAKEVARFLMEEDQDEHNDALQKAINAFEMKNGAFNAENVMRYKRGKLAVKDAQEQQRQERLRKIERTERNLQMLDGCFGSFVLMVGVPVALTIFAIWFVISHF